VVGDRVYVAGGWNLHGDSHDHWHSTAWSADLTKRPLVWERIPDPPFQRRALALAARGGKVYAIGGMAKEGGPTRRTDVFDTRDGVWTQGPDLIGEKPIDGFGAAACGAGDALYVSSLAGVVQKLSADGSKWEVAAPLDRPRFFHGMAVCDGKLIVVGGANMADGKTPETQTIPLAAAGG
jgi:hypothetical protein